jgi:biotin carboxylase
MDAGYGGHGVFICYDHKDLENYFQGLFKTTIVFKIKKFIKNLFFVSIFSSNCKISLQQFIKGTEGQAPFCANEGHVFGQNAMKRVRTLTSTTGPSTVIEGIVNPEIENYVKIVANELKYTGFGSLEFIIEEKSGLPYVIEFNPRPTPTCHISNSIMPNDLCRLFFRGLNNLPIKLGEFMPYTLAMYPGELLRDPQSSFLREAYHDIPTDDLALLKTLGNSIKP